MTGAVAEMRARRDLGARSRFFGFLESFRCCAFRGDREDCDYSMQAASAACFELTNEALKRIAVRGHGGDDHVRMGDDAPARTAPVFDGD